MYLGIDLGTTGLKCVMFENDGTVMAEYNEEYPLIFVDSFGSIIWFFPNPVYGSFPSSI